MAWTVLTYAFGSLLTSTKMTQLFDDVDLVRQSVMNTLTGVGTLDLTQSDVVNNVTQLFFQSGTGLGIDLNGRTITMGGGTLNMENGTIINEGVSNLPIVVAGGVTTAAGNAGELIDADTSFDFSTELTLNENFVTITTTYTTILFNVSSLIDADTIGLGFSDNMILDEAIPKGTGYTVYSNLNNLDWERIDQQAGAAAITYTTSPGQRDKFFKVEFNDDIGGASNSITITHGDDGAAPYVTSNVYNVNSDYSRVFLKTVTASSQILATKAGASVSITAKLLESATIS